MQKSSRRHRKNSGGRTIHVPTFEKEENSDNERVKDPPGCPGERIFDVYYAVSPELP